MAASFSIRGYARGTAAADLGPFGLAAKDLPPMEVRAFRWWEDELAALKGMGGRAPKKRSISDLFAAAPPVDAPGGGGGEAAAEVEDEVLRAIVKRTRERKRRRRLEEAAAAEMSAGEARDAEADLAREKALDKPNLRDELDIPEASEEPETEQHITTDKEKIPDLKGRKHGKINSIQKKKADKLMYIESRKAIKVGKQRDLKRTLPLHSIMKKYTKHTSVKMVKEKQRNSKRAGVIELCHKSVKRVKFSEANDSICKLFSYAMTSSSSSTDMSSEGDKHIVAESSSSHMPEKAFTKATEANANTDHENYCKVSNTGLSSGLFDLNQALPETTDLNDPYVSNSEVSNLEHTQDGTFSADKQVLDKGREKQKDWSFDPNGQEHQQHATDLDTRVKGKSPYTLPSRAVQDSVQLQQSWGSKTLQHGVSQLSTGGELPSCQFREYNLSHSEKPNFHSEMNVQQEFRPAAGQQIVRLMGKDLTVSKHTGPSIKDHPTTQMVLELPRQGQPFLSLQSQSIPIVSANSASTAHVSASSASTTQVHFGYRTPHSFSHPLPTVNVFSGDPSPYEDRFRDFANSQSHRNVLLGCPPPPNHGSVAFLQNSQAPWRYYSDHSTRTESPSAPFLPAMMQHVTPSSDYHANLPQTYGVYSVHPHNSASSALNHPVSGSRASARAVADNSNTASSSRHVLRSGPVKLGAGAKHILIPSENTEDDNSAQVYSCVSFGSKNGNVSRPQSKGADFRKF